jgi:long-chain-alcohol oxidase
LSFFLFPTKKVAELMVTRCIREAVLLGWVVLWMLGTRLGTLLLCGTLSLSGAAGELPSLHRFADMPMERWEAALQRWNRTRWFFPLRIVFALVKILSHYVFYAMVSLCWHLFLVCYLCFYSFLVFYYT